MAPKETLPEVERLSNLLRSEMQHDNRFWVEAGRQSGGCAVKTISQAAHLKELRRCLVEDRMWKLWRWALYGVAGKHGIEQEVVQKNIVLLCI